VLSAQLNTTTLKESDPTNSTWLANLLESTSQLASSFHLCYELKPQNFLNLASSLYDPSYMCCRRDEGSIDDPLDASIVCEELQENFKFVEVLEAISVLFLVFLSVHWLQSSFQQMIHKIQTNSLIFTFVTSDSTEIGSLVPEILTLKYTVTAIIGHFIDCISIVKKFNFVRKFEEEVVEGLSVKISYLIFRLPTMFLILGLSFVRVFVPQSRPNYVDADYVDVYHPALGDSSFWLAIYENFGFNLAYLISWSVICVVFIFTLIVQIFALTNEESWFEYSNVEAERTEENSAYISLINLITSVWTLSICCAFIGIIWVFISYWTLFTKLVFTSIAVVFIMKFAAQGLAYPRFISQATGGQKLVLAIKIFGSILNEALCLLTFMALAFFAAQTFFSLIWYNVLNVVLYQTRLPVIIFCATLGIIFQNLWNDIATPFEVFYRALLLKCQDVYIELSSKNIMLPQNEEQRTFLKQIKCDAKAERDREKEAFYSKQTLSVEQLNELLTSWDYNANAKIVDTDTDENYLIITLDFVICIYEDLMAAYSSMNLVFKYLFSVVVSAITFVAFWYISNFNNFANDQLSNVAILATGFLPQVLGMGVKEKIETYVEKRLDAAINIALDARKCAGLTLAVLHNIRDRSAIKEWIDSVSKDKNTEAANYGTSEEPSTVVVSSYDDGNSNDTMRKRAPAASESQPLLGGDAQQ